MASSNPPGGVTSDVVSQMAGLSISDSPMPSATAAVESASTDNGIQGIPTRVQGAQNVELKDSTMYGGKGVFATENFGDGDLVFSIKQPLLAIVSSGIMTETVYEKLTYFRLVRISSLLPAITASPRSSF